MGSDRRRSLGVDSDEVIDLLVARPMEDESRPKRKVTPHETERRSRRMAVTFPDESWPQAVLALAQRWGLNPSDVMTLAFSRLMAAVQEGEMGRPVGEARRNWQRAGAMLELPWEPE